MELSGKIKQISEVKEYGSNGFCKREFVIITDEKYPQHIPLELIQYNCELIDAFKVGDVVSCQINVNGREWTSSEGDVRHFLSISVWKIDAVDAQEQTVVVDETKEQPDDLPF
jgi:hypothetical protein